MTETPKDMAIEPVYSRARPKSPVNGMVWFDQSCSPSVRTEFRDGKWFKTGEMYMKDWQSGNHRFDPIDQTWKPK